MLAPITLEKATSDTDYKVSSSSNAEMTDGEALVSNDLQDRRASSSSQEVPTLLVDGPEENTADEGEELSHPSPASPETPIKPATRRFDSHTDKTRSSGMSLQNRL